jgi:hypothetical protein
MSALPASHEVGQRQHDRLAYLDSCSFPVAFDLQVRGRFQLFPDAQGQPARLLLDEHWTGTGTANGKYVIEHAAQNNRWISSAAPQPSPARSTTRSRSGGVVIHDSGLLRFDGNGNSRSRPARTRDSAVTPLRFTNSAQHCPDLKQARQAKLQRAL